MSFEFAACLVTLFLLATPFGFKRDEAGGAAVETQS